jgi:hypothetical protein
MRETSDARTLHRRRGRMNRRSAQGARGMTRGSARQRAACSDASVERLPTGAAERAPCVRLRRPPGRSRPRPPAHRRRAVYAAERAMGGRSAGSRAGPRGATPARVNTRAPAVATATVGTAEAVVGRATRRRAQGQAPWQGQVHCRHPPSSSPGAGARGPASITDARSAATILSVAAVAVRASPRSAATLARLATLSAVVSARHASKRAAGTRRAALRRTRSAHEPACERGDLGMGWGDAPST